MENAAIAVSKLFGSNPTTSSQTENGTIASDAATQEIDTEANTTLDSEVAAPIVDEHIDTKVDKQVAPAVEHTHVTKAHETREQTFVEKEKHQDHYHTTIQPLTDSEVAPEKHDQVQETEHRSIDRDDGAAKAKAEAEREAAGFESTRDETRAEVKTTEPEQVDEHVHHHYHETVQPVIEKEVLVPSVTHKRIDVKEKIQEPATYEGVTTNEAVSVEEFAKKN